MSRIIAKIPNPDPTPLQCHAAVWHKWSHRRCTRTGTVVEVVDGVERRFCTAHSSAKIQQRSAEQTARWKAQNREWAKQSILAEIARAVLRADPSSLPEEIRKLREKYEET